jgi:hypothetical protein
MVTQSREECSEYCWQFVAFDDHQGFPFLPKKGKPHLYQPASAIDVRVTYMAAAATNGQMTNRQYLFYKHFFCKKG